MITLKKLMKKRSQVIDPERSRSNRTMGGNYQGLFTKLNKPI